ncbi:MULTISPECIES: M28 family peptidase [Sulfolobaceae]|uniref:M28 family peptidase n=1 Tax=Sulfolobaceae TaxID=118883 RepID=UPI000845BD2B|nr:MULTISPECIES: M28 family peptidase [unclassified Sulfolobus]
MLELTSKIYRLGEIIHGSEKEKKALKMIKDSLEFDEGISIRQLPVNTKEWAIKFQKLLINNKEVEDFTLFPYSRGSVKGRVGSNILQFSFPNHPFKVKDLYKVAIEQGAEALIFYENSLKRRITLGDVNIPILMIPQKLEKGTVIEIEAESELKDTISYNLEVELREGKDDYILIGAHIDHWLTGYHDNLFSVDTLLSLIYSKEIMVRNHGMKVVFFSSEEGPRCCAGSFQYPKDGVSIAIVLDALFPNRVVFSAIPSLWDFSKYFKLKRIEMPTPFSDHFSFIQHGIPAVVLYNDDLIPYYHSDRDVEFNEDEQYKLSIIGSLRKMLEEVDKHSVDELRLNKFGTNKILPDYVNLTSMFG